MAVAGPNFRVALQLSMGTFCNERELTPSTKSVYKGHMTLIIKHRFDNDTPTPAINIGAYVRMEGQDMGTGIVVCINDSDVLDERTNKVFHQRVYQVHWLDMNDGTTYGFHAENEIKPSSRSVPKFASEEEAEAWMDAQVTPGNWTAAAQDATDSASDMDVALQKMLEEGKKDD